MRRAVQKRVEVAARVRDFMRAHPPGPTTHKALVERLEGLLGRAETLAIQERAGRLEELAAATRRNQLRGAIQFELLPHLVRVGQLAGRDHPELAGKFQLRSPDATHLSFLTSTKRMLALGEANQELFISLGLSDNLLSDLREAVTQFEVSTTSGRAGLVEHVTARADLGKVTFELMKTVELINGLNRYRFRSNPELLTAWEGVRTIGPRARSASEGGVTPPSGGESPAA